MPSESSDSPFHFTEVTFCEALPILLFHGKILQAIHISTNTANRAVASLKPGSTVGNNVKVETTTPPSTTYYYILFRILNG